MEKTKKPIFKKWWFWVIIIIVIIAIAGNSSNNTQNSAPTSGSSDIQTSSEANTPVTNNSKKYSVGETYKDNNVAITFLSLDADFKGYPEYSDIKSGNKIIKAEFEFENLGTSDFFASAYNFDCYADGYDCESFWSVDDNTFNSSLSSGKKTKGSVYFQIPENATAVSLEYELNAWTSQKVEFLVK